MVDYGKNGTTSLFRRALRILGVIGIALSVAGCASTPFADEESGIASVHLAAVFIEGPDVLSDPDRRELVEPELQVGGRSVVPWITYTVPAESDPFSIDLATLRSSVAFAYERAFREAAGEAIAPVCETESLIGIEAVRKKAASVEDWERFIGAPETLQFARSNGSVALLFARVQVEPDLTVPHVSSEFDGEETGGGSIEFHAAENFPLIVQIDVDSRIEARTAKQPDANPLRRFFNATYARDGTPEYRFEVERRPEAVLVSGEPPPYIVRVQGGVYRHTLKQTDVADDLVQAAERLGQAAARNIKPRIRRNERG